jgi:hypothetical protein
VCTVEGGFEVKYYYEAKNWGLNILVCLYGTSAKVHPNQQQTHHLQICLSIDLVTYKEFLEMGVEQAGCHQQRVTTGVITKKKCLHQGSGTGFEAL